MKSTAPLACLLAAALFLTAAGCKNSVTSRAAPAAGTGFVPMSELAADPSLPFNKVWFKTGVDFSSFKSVYVPGVNTRYLLEDTWWQASFRKDKMEQDAKDVAAFLRQHLIDAFKNDPKKRFAVADAAGPGVLVLDVALTQLVPSNPVIEALTLAAPYGSGAAVQVAARSSGEVATVAFEARLIDGATGDTVAMFADREQAKAAIVDLNALTWYGEAHVIIGEWSGQFVAVMDRKPGEVIKPAETFTLKPW
jgi:hypothetical protein